MIYKKLARLRERIQSELHSEILVTPEVILVEPGSIPAPEGKVQRAGLTTVNYKKGGIKWLASFPFLPRINQEELRKLLAFFQEGINIRAITISSANGFGVIKIFLIANSSKAFELLRNHNFPVYLQEVIAVVMNDEPGGLHRVARALAENQINIEDAYGL